MHNLNTELPIKENIYMNKIITYPSKEEKGIAEGWCYYISKKQYTQQQQDHTSQLST